MVFTKLITYTVKEIDKINKYNSKGFIFRKLAHHKLVKLNNKIGEIKKSIWIPGLEIDYEDLAAYLSLLDVCKVNNIKTGMEGIVTYSNDGEAGMYFYKDRYTSSEFTISVRPIQGGNHRITTTHNQNYKTRLSSKFINEIPKTTIGTKDDSVKPKYNSGRVNDIKNQMKTYIFDDIYRYMLFTAANVERGKKYEPETTTTESTSNKR